MKKTFYSPLVVAGLFTVVLLSGCAGTMPQTAEEFRKAVPDALTAEVETFDVNRPFRVVAKAFKNNGPRCLDKAIEITTRNQTKYGVTYSTYTVTYKPTVMVNGDKAELHVQQHMDNTLKIYKEPEGGYYLLVADAYPVSKNKTRVDLYRPAIGSKVLIKAVKGWATGNNNGCPDLTKN